jgi:hypothetical protein
MLSVTKEALKLGFNACFVTLNLLVTLDAHIAAHNWARTGRQTGHNAAQRRRCGAVVCCDVQESRAGEANWAKRRATPWY